MLKCKYKCIEGVEFSLRKSWINLLKSIYYS